MQRHSLIYVRTLAFSAALLILIGGLAVWDLGSIQGSTQAASQAYPWVYLRGDAPLSRSENLVELLIVGDVMLGRGVAAEEDVFQAVAAQLQSADLALGNFEGAISSESSKFAQAKFVAVEAIPGGGSYTGDSASLAPETRDILYAPYQLLAPESAGGQLRAAGFDLLGLANNHGLDAGESGLSNTIAVLEAAGLTPVGMPEAEVLSPAVVQQVHNVSIAFLAFNLIPPGPDGFMHRPSTDAIAAAIRRAREEADAVVVLVHWGWEYQLHVDPAQRALAQTMADAGADLILGSHPHVVQELGIYPVAQSNRVDTREALVAYSLGNFVFDQGQGETGQGLALRAFLDAEGLRAVQALPVRAGPRPRWMPTDESVALLERIAPTPEHLEDLPRNGLSCDERGCWPVSIPEAPTGGSDREENTSGLFSSGPVDLTGDGVPEIVRRQWETAAIYQDNRLVWESPPEWRVADLALGDPNDDGRYELLLALHKRLPGGGESSHPFILGYRGGMYRVLWGGSTVSEPLLEVELGDLDGDGIQELVVLEENAVSVWRWHGWGFALFWRSDAGAYRDLALIPQDDGTSIISLVAKTQ